MNESNSLTEITRRAILDHYSMGDVNWSGRLPEDDFLARLYDLSELPSQDHRFRTAAADIYQHRIAWTDWPNDWVFYDTRFNLLYGSDENFTRFLVETVHPVVRPDTAEARKLVEELNSHLKADGWSIVEQRLISNKPLFVALRSGSRAAAFEEVTGWTKVDRQLVDAKARLDGATNEEHYQIVGLLCREALISLAQEVYDPARHHPTDGVIPSAADAGRMLEAFLMTELRGGSNEEARAHGKAALKLAVALQHRRTADMRMAALCVEATASVTNLVAILAGRRG